LLINNNKLIIDAYTNKGNRMNKQLEKFARSELKDGLSKLKEHNHFIFKCMYSHKNLDANINDVVDVLPVEKLDWAMQQVQRSVEEQT
jgi:hypothetical protein